MASDLSDKELRVLTNAFNASDIDGDGFISRSDLKASSGLIRDEEVEVLYQSLKQSRSSDPSDDHITFEEFARGVMDFPFLLEQFQQELEELSPAEASRSGVKRENLFIDIECIEEEADDTSPKNSKLKSAGSQQRSFVFPGKGNTIFDFPNPGKPSDYSFMAAAYSVLSNLCKQSFESLPAPTPTTLSIDPAASLNLDELSEKTLLVVSKLQNRFSRTEHSSLVSSLTEGIKLLVQQIEDNTRAYEDIMEDYQHRLESNTETICDLERRCEMAETSYTLLFDRLKAMEEEMKLEHTHKEQYLQETSHLRDLLKSKEMQGERASNEMEEIQRTIADKEEQISKLQREVRRLNSKRVLAELPVNDGTNTMEIRTNRRERMSSGTVLTTLKDRISAKVSPALSPTSSSRLSAARGSETRQLTMLNALLSDKQKQIKANSKLLQDKQRQLEQWEYQLKCRETDLESGMGAQVDSLREELEVMRRRLYAEQNKSKQLELALNDVSRQSISARIETGENVFEEFSLGKDLEPHFLVEERHRAVLLVERREQVHVLPRRKPEDRLQKRLSKEGCCGFFCC